MTDLYSRTVSLVDIATTFPKKVKVPLDDLFVYIELLSECGFNYRNIAKMACIFEGQLPYVKFSMRNGNVFLIPESEVEMMRDEFKEMKACEHEEELIL